MTSSGRKLEGSRDLGIENFGNGLNLEIVVARTERSHLPALSLSGTVGDVCGLGTRHSAVFLNPFEVAIFAPAAFHGPSSASCQHRFHVDLVQRDGTSAPDTGRDLAKQRVGERLLHWKNVGNLETSQHRAHAA